MSTGTGLALLGVWLCVAAALLASTGAAGPMVIVALGVTHWLS
jgi:hypothetical protein